MYNENIFNCYEYKTRWNTTRIDQYKLKLDEIVDRDSILAAMSH